MATNTVMPGHRTRTNFVEGQAAPAQQQRPANTSTGVGAAFEMQERKEPNFIQFADGEQLEGVLISIMRMEVQGKPANKYTLLDPDTNELFAFLGTYMIDTKLRPTDRGRYVRVRCEGDSDVVRNGRAMKKFYVAVSSKPVTEVLGAAQSDGTYITNDDIPF
jgi:hypothetical protein